mgnify:CR=1 FL=1
MVRKGSLSPEFDESRNIALEKALGDITKKYGEGSIMRLGESHHLEVEAIPCLLYTSPSPRDRTRSRMPSSA